MEAAMNNAEASSSFSPVTLLKRLLDKIHISRGMLKIRISVMELGRFTLLGWVRRPIGIQFDYAPRREGTQSRRKGKLDETRVASLSSKTVRQNSEVHRLVPVFSRERKDGWLLRTGASPIQRLLLLGDDFIFDLVVSGLGNNLLLHQIRLGFIGAAVDDLLRIGCANAGQGIELVLGGAVDVEQVACGSGCGWGLGARLRCGGPGHAQRTEQSERGDRDENACNSILTSHCFSP